MSSHPVLFPTFTRWVKHLSHIFSIAPLPVRIALFPTFLAFGSVPLILMVLFTPTSITPKAANTLYQPVNNPVPEHTNNAPQAPLLLSKTFPPVIKGEIYSTNFIIDDADNEDVVTVSVSNLPPGISLSPCQPSFSIKGNLVVNCHLSGTTNARAGTYSVIIQLTDTYNLTTRYTVNLEVIGKNTLLELF